jgi:hypothetical protein
MPGIQPFKKEHGKTKPSAENSQQLQVAYGEVETLICHLENSARKGSYLTEVFDFFFFPDGKLRQCQKKSKEFSSLEGWAVNCAGGIAHPFIA